MHSTQRFVTGEIRVRLHRGTAVVVGRRSEHSLYSTALATYGKGDAFDHKAAEGFIGVFGLPLRNQSRIQALWSRSSEATLQIPRTVVSAKPTRKAKARSQASKRKRP